MRPDLGWIFQNRIVMPLGIAVAVYLLVFHRLADRGFGAAMRRVPDSMLPGI